ncbi:MAG TPA: thioesterase family protein [Dehalococcoidia bacterium]|jgi:acyl-CoA thioester hydrolase|nr:thioesterase family protein [Dehalococcoidia bacterium]
MPKSDFKFYTTTRVRWMECDAQGIAFNGAYLGYLEIAQAEYFRNLGFSIYKIAQRGYFDSAVVKATLEFRAPARTDDILELHTRVSRIGNTSLTLDVEVYLQESEKLLSLMQAVYAGFYPQSMETRPVPDEIRALVDHFEATGQVLPLENFPALVEAAH